MALTLTEINAYTYQDIIPKTTEVIFLNSPVLTRLHTQRMERFTGGLQIQRPIIIGELNGDAIGRGEQMNIDFVTTDTALLENLSLFYCNITLYGYDAMRNDGEAAVFSQVEMKFLNASLKMAKLLATNMYLSLQDAGRSKYLEGFKAWYDDGNAYPSVGGILRSDVTPVTLPSNVGGLNAYTQNLTAFSLQAVNVAYGASWFGADHIDMLVATQNGWNLIWNQMQPNQRYYDKESDLGVAGFQAFRFNAAEVVVDKYMPTGASGVMYGMNTKYIEWYFSTNPLFQFGWTGFKGANSTIDVAGQYLVGSQIIVANPRSGFKLTSTTGLF